MAGDAGRSAVLVVDDNRANLVAMEALLSSLDLDVKTAQSGEDALKEILQRDFAVLQAAVLLTALSIFLLNIFIDACYALLDARVREPARV